MFVPCNDFPHQPFGSVFRGKLFFHHMVRVQRVYRKLYKHWTCQRNQRNRIKLTELQTGLIYIELNHESNSLALKIRDKTCFEPNKNGITCAVVKYLQTPDQ